jgi:hypothetical protein
MKTKVIMSLAVGGLYLLLSNVNAQDLNGGLVVHTPFDINANDLSSNQYDALLVGASIHPEGVVGNGCVYLDGIDDYVEFPRNKVYFNTNYSISIWCKMLSARLWERILDFNQDEPQSGNAVTWLVGRSPENNTHDMWFDQWVIHQGIAVESIINIMQTPANAYLNYHIKTNEWAHYVITYHATKPNKIGIQKNRKGEEVPLEGVVTLYVNAEKIGTNEYCLKPQNIPTLSNWLGRSRFAPDPFYHGYMDDFRIYDRALNEKEIEDLFLLKK